VGDYTAIIIMKNVVMLLTLRCWLSLSLSWLTWIMPCLCFLMAFKSDDDHPSNNHPNDLSSQKPTRNNNSNNSRI